MKQISFRSFLALLFLFGISIRISMTNKYVNNLQEALRSRLQAAAKSQV